MMRILTAVAVLLLARATFAQPVPAPERQPVGTTAKSTPDSAVNQILEPIRAKHSLPGLAGAILSRRKVVAIGAVGVRKQGAPEPFTVNDVIHLGSCTKSITATMLAQLVEERKLAWSSTLGAVLRDLADGMHPDYRQVTLTQLLTHRSGVPRNGPWQELGPTRSTTEQRRELVRRLLGNAPESKSGSKYAYSNAGYAIAGLMAETVTGQSWEDLMRERIFRPLRMASAGFGPPGTAGQIDQPWGHVREADHWKPLQSDNAPALGPAGTVHCTIGDWARYVAEHIEGYHGRSRMLTKATFRQLQVPEEGQEYAFGWANVARSWAHGRALTHAGSNKMWYAVVWVAPERNFAVFAATNAGGHTTAQACDEVAAALIRHYQSRFAKK
jgi:CubicO group peptidase (beta-lactamase class C family)